MKIKTYLVSTLAEAVEQIKKDLGPDAVILSTRKKTGTSWLGGGAKLEVTAAIDVADPLEKEAAPNQPMMGQTIKMIAKMTEERLTPLHEEMKLLRESISTLKPTAPAEAPVVESQHPTLHWRSDINNLCEKLLWHRIRPSVVKDLGDYLDRFAEADLPLEKLQNIAAEWIMETMPAVLKPIQIRNLPRTIAVVGPTGSGKTTTLVKLATDFVINKKKRVAFITLDHFRIGAEDQLKKYADILKVPCEVAKNEEDFKTLTEIFLDVDYILVDTAGRSLYDVDAIEETKNILGSVPNVYRLLALPVALQGPDLQRSLRQFKILSPNALIMTKLDESACFGSLYNASRDSVLPLAYFTTGQQVPEDFEIATMERVVDCLFNFSGSFEVTEEERMEWSVL